MEKIISEPHESSSKKGNTLLGLQVLSDFGDQITAALLALSILDITKSTTQVGLVYFINTIGFILFTILGGYLGDRISKKNILYYSDMGRGLVVLLMIVALFIKSIVLIYFASFFLSLLSSIHRPVKFSLWAQSIPKNRLELYNCFSELSTHSSVIIGPIIASFLVAQTLTNWGFVLDALTFFTCAFIFSAIITDQPTTKPIQHSGDLFTGLKIIFQDKILFRYISYDAIQMLAHGAFNATFLVLAQRDFGWSKTEYSYYLSITAGFAIFGATLGTVKYIANANATVKLICCTIISALSLGLVLYFKTFMICALLLGICNTVAIIAMIVTKTKAQMQGQSYYSEHLSSILAMRTVVIKSATLLGSGACLAITNFLNLETTLWFFLIPLAVGFLPFFVGERRPQMNCQLREF